MQLKKLGIIAFSLVLTAAVQATVFAHECNPSRRWGTVQGTYPNQKAYIVAQAYNLDSTYTNAFNWSCINWTNKSNGDVEIVQSASNAKVTVTSNYWNSAWGNAYAATSSSVSTSTTPNIIVSATIYVNKSNTSSWSDEDKEYNFNHEFGHCLGSNETNDGTRSVLKQGKGSTFGWGNGFQWPQDHDRADMSAYYY